MKKSIQFSLNDWIVYEVVGEELMVAVSKDELKRILHLENRYGGKHNIPDGELVEVIPLIDSATVTNGLDLSPVTRYKVELNKLKGTIIPHIPV